MSKSQVSTKDDHIYPVVHPEMLLSSSYYYSVYQAT